MPKKKFTGKITLNSVGAAYKGDATPQELEKYVEGFHHADFVSALRNTDQVPEDIAPSEDNMVLVPFRLISATIVGAGSWKATEFSEDVLRDSMGMLMNQPVYTNHDDWKVESALGKVEQVAWTSSFRQLDMQEGSITIPSGIDGVLSILTTDERGKSIATKVVAGIINSNSVSVYFDWEPSHPIESNEDLYSFYDKIGTFDEDGNMYRRIVTKITGYAETSLVTMGADPFAKKINSDGTVNRPELGAAVDFAKDKDAVSEKFNNITIDGAISYAKFSALSDTVNKAIQGLIDTGRYTNRTEVLQSIAETCNCTVRTIQNYLNGTSCAPQDRLNAMSGILMIAPAQLIQAAELDGCSYTDATPTPVIASEVVTTDLEKTATNNACDEDEDDDDMGEGKDDEDMKDEEEDYAKVKAELEALQNSYNQLKVENEGTLVELNAVKAEKQELSQVQAKLTALEAEKAGLEQALKEAKQLASKNETLAAVGTKTLEAARKQALKAYKARKGANIQPAILKLIQDSDELELLHSIIKDNGAALAEEFTYACAKCHSTDISFGSVKLPKQNIKAYADEPQEEVEEKTVEDTIKEKYQKKSFVE